MKLKSFFDEIVSWIIGFVKYNIFTIYHEFV